MAFTALVEDGEGQGATRRKRRARRRRPATSVDSTIREEGSGSLEETELAFALPPSEARRTCFGRFEATPPAAQAGPRALRASATDVIARTRTTGSPGGLSTLPAAPESERRPEVSTSARAALFATSRDVNALPHASGGLFSPPAGATASGSPQQPARKACTLRTAAPAPACAAPRCSHSAAAQRVTAIARTKLSTPAQAAAAP